MHGSYLSSLVTFTSFKENQDWVHVRPTDDTASPLSKDYFEKKIWAVDIPGDAKARIDWQHKLSMEGSEILGVIFLIDSLTIASQMKACTQLVSLFNFLFVLNIFAKIIF